MTGKKRGPDKPAGEDGTPEKPLPQQVEPELDVAGAKADRAEPPEAGGGPEEAAEAAGETPQEAGEEAAEARDPEAEIDSLKDQLLRALAEVENVRRRAAKDRDEERKYAIAGFARDLLAVADNLRRALDSVPAEAREEDGALKSLIEGVEITERELINAFSGHRIEKIEPHGEMFDYNRHQAMFEVEDSSKPPGTIVQVVQSGYLIGERLLRPAMVGVSKGSGQDEGTDEGGDKGADGDAGPPETGKRVDTTA